MFFPFPGQNRVAAVVSRGNAQCSHRLAVASMVALLCSQRADAVLIQSDEFQDPVLNTAVWTWENPSGTSSYSVVDGAFRVSIGSGNDQWAGINKAPRLLSQQAATTWTMETRVLTNSGGASTFGGLAVYKDARNWFMWGQVGTAAMEASGFIDERFTHPVAKMAPRFSHFRIRRVGQVYYFDASPDGTNWTNGNVFTDTTGALDGARIGLMAKNWGKNSQFQMTFDYFRVDGDDLMPSAIKGIFSTELIAQQTGELSHNLTHLVDFCGGDLGVAFEWIGRTFFAFGDTVGCDTTAVWRSNTLAYTSDITPDTNLADGLRFDGWITDAEGHVKELIPEDRRTITAIPTGALGTAARGYIYYMQVTDWNTWSCNLSSIASAASTNPGVWTKHNTTIAWAPGNFNMVAVLKQGTTLYIFGTPCGRYGSIKLMAVPESQILNKSAYLYLAGYSGTQPRWSSLETAAITVAGGPAGELSVRYNGWLGRFIMTYLDEPKGLLVVRESPAPWGPWSAPVPIASYADYPQMYGAFMKQGFDENGGESFYYMMSLWGPYNTYWMKTTFAR